MKLGQQTYYIDSIRIRYDKLSLQSLFYDYFKYYLDKHGNYIYQDIINNKVTNLFTLANHKDNQGKQYQLLEFNGFKKYKQRDIHLHKAFKQVIELLNDNDIDYYLSKIDLAIDFYNTDIKNFKGTNRKKTNVVTFSIDSLNEQELEDIRLNKNTFYLEKQVKNNSRREQRAYIYNKSIKEQLEIDNLYRFEISLNNFSKIFKEHIISTIELNYLTSHYKIKRDIDTKEEIVKQQIYNSFYLIELKLLLIKEIKKRLNKYIIEHQNKTISFDFSLLEETINSTINMKLR